MPFTRRHKAVLMALTLHSTAAPMGGSASPHLVVAGECQPYVSIVSRLSVTIGFLISFFFAVAHHEVRAEPSFLYSSWEPRVVNTISNAPVTFTSVVTGNPTSVAFVPKSGPLVPLTPVGDDTYQMTLHPEDILDGYQTGHGHHFVGFLDIVGNNTTSRRNLSVNVRDETMPSVQVVSLNETAQVGTHIVNLRDDELWLSGWAPVDVLNRFYDHFEDKFDFVNVVSQVTTGRNRGYSSVRNDIRGIGVSRKDNGNTYGSANRLQGIINYPIDSFFDLGIRGANHEIGHRWGIFLDFPSLDAPGPHWPVSDFARGIMGFNLAGGVGGQFPYDFIEQPDGTFLVQGTELTHEFNDLELYLMGLMAPEEVSPGRVFLNQNQQDQLFHSGILEGPAEFVTIEDIIDLNGARIPAAGETQTHFTLASIILSADRLLTEDEMAFFDYMAARGEAINELPYTLGLASGVTKPFYLATRGLATLSTTMVLAGDFDSDGDVDGDDFLVWQNGFPISVGAALLDGDADADGDVDGEDFLIWQNNFPYPATLSSVPEPNSLVLLALGGLMMLRRCTGCRVP